MLRSNIIRSTADGHAMLWQRHLVEPWRTAQRLVQCQPCRLRRIACACTNSPSSIKDAANSGSADKGERTHTTKRTRKWPATIGQHTFVTQKAAEEYTRALLRSVDETDDLQHTHPEAYEFIYALMQRHPTAVAKLNGLQRVKVEVVSWPRPNVPAHGLYIEYSDGREDDISWRACISGRSKTDRHYLKVAMRQAVQYQIDEFREQAFRQGVQGCAECGEETACGYYQVDHCPPVFEVLVERFLSGRTDVPEKVAEKPRIAFHHCFLPADAAFEDAWVQFHKQHARLRMVCPACNRDWNLHRQRKSAVA